MSESMRVSIVDDSITARMWVVTLLSMLTANTQVKVQERAAKLGFGFIPKPISDEKIESFIDASEASRG